METTARTESKKGVFNNLTVTGDVRESFYPIKGWRVDNGHVNNDNGEHLASWWLNSDETQQVNFGSNATDKGAILDAIDGFISSAKGGAE